MGPQQNAEVAAQSLVIVYDPESGQIAHVHHFVTMKGGQHPSEEERREQALEDCGHAQPGASGMEMGVLEVPPTAVKPEVNYKVDPRRRVLVEHRPKPTKKRVRGS